MVKYLIFYTFHKLNPLSINRLNQIKRLNPQADIVPCFGAGQRTIPRRGMSNRLPFSIFLDANFRFTELSYCKKILPERSSKKLCKETINEINSALDELELEPYFDFTPLGYYNQDKSILNWFHTKGKKYDFDYLIYLEYDVFMTQNVSNIYGKYQCDAGFVGLKKPSPGWGWIETPFGVKQTLGSWMRSRGYEPILYKCFFPGHMISRTVLEAMESIRLPMGFCELRMPTIIKAMGFSCVNLDFPFVALKRISKQLIEKNSSYGIFHPVRDNIELS